MGKWNIKKEKLIFDQTSWSKDQLAYMKYSIGETAFNEYINSKKVVVSDCDGILTSGKSLYNSKEKLLKEYGAYDKEIISFLIKLNWKFIFVTWDSLGQHITFRRLADLKKNFPKENFSYQTANSIDRYELVKDLKKSFDIVSFIGDSLSDIPAICEANISGTTNNAPEIVQKYCDYVSDLDGGSGGFADIIFSIHEKIVFNKGQNNDK